MSCQIWCDEYDAVWRRVQLPLTHGRFMSVYRWRLGLHLACSGNKSCVCVTVLRPCIWTHFLLWCLIWLTWQWQATVDSYHCHLLTEQGNRNRKKKMSVAEPQWKRRNNRMLKKTGGKRERLYKTGNSWKGSNKREENIQRERLFIFSVAFS